MGEEIKIGGMDTPKFVAKSALRFLSGTSLSKISGMLRDVAMAFYFGTSPSIAAFLLSFRFVYLARRLFGESLLHQGFIPHFEELRAASSKSAALFFRDLLWTMVIFLTGIVILSELILFFFSGQIPFLSSLMIPGIFFICLFGFCTGLLQSEKSFFLPSVSPMVSNFVWILGILLFHKLPSEKAVIGLAVFISIAFFFQWLAVMPKVWSFLKTHLTKKEIFRGEIFSSEIQKLLRPLLLGMLGVASMQINSALDGVFARFASPEGPAYLWYAIRLQQLPLSLFGIALSTALLPSLSRALASQNAEKYFSLIRFAKKRAFTFSFPCFIGIFVLGLSSVNLLFGRGDFSQEATFQTTLCLWCYGLGLLPMVMVQIYAPAYYAKKDYKTPAMGFVFATILNIVLNALFVFVFRLGPASIALATSIASLMNCLFLSRIVPSGGTYSLRFIGSTTLAGLLTLAFGYLVLGDGTLRLGSAKLPREMLSQLFHFFSQAGLYFALFFYFSISAQRKSTSYSSDM